MKKQVSNNYRARRRMPVVGLRGIAQSFISVGIPTVIESSVKEEYSYFKKHSQKDILYSFTGEVKVKV